MNTFFSKKQEIPLQTKEDFEDLLKSLKYNQYKSSLYIYDETLSDINADRRINFTKSWMNITDLNSFKYKFEEKDIKKEILHLSKSIKFNNNVKLLLLDGQILPQKSFKDIADCLSVNNSIKYLSLHSSGLGDIGSKYLADALINNGILETLMLESNHIGASGAEHFAESLKDNKTLSSIILRGNKLGDIGAKYIGEMLKVNNSIQSLGVGDNEIGDDGFYYIFNGLEDNKILKNLWMSENKGTEITAGFLAEILTKKTSNLTSLWANNNQMNDEGALEIAEALKSNENLKTLTMDLNYFTKTGLIAIAEGLKFNHTLSNLWLDGNEFDDDVIIKFAEMLKFSNSIDTIWFNGNHITKKAYDKLACSLVFNENIKTILFGGDKLEKDFEDFVESINLINQENKKLNESGENVQIESLKSELLPRKNSNGKRYSNSSEENLEHNLTGTRNLTSKASFELDDEFINQIFEERNKKIHENSEKIVKKYSDLVPIEDEEREKLEMKINKLQYNNNKINEIVIEKCYKSFKYLHLLEKTFLDCLTVKKIFEDDGLSCIEKNFIDQLNINNYDEINEDEIFSREEELDLSELNLQKRIRNKHLISCNKNSQKYSYELSDKDKYASIKESEDENKSNQDISKESISDSKTKSNEKIQNVLETNLFNYQELDFLKDDEENLLIIKRGAYSKILLATYWDKIVTVKLIEINKIDIKKFMEELLEILENPNDLCNKIIGYSITNTQIYLVYNFNDCCSLFNLIHQKKLNIPVENLVFYVNNIIQIINFYHEKKILISYKDINLSNLYISKDGENLFADIFGYSTTVYINKAKDIKQCGSISHMAPELFTGNKLNFSSDIYSFGIILYEIFSTKIPYEGKRERDIIMEIVKGKRPDLEFLRKDTPFEFIELIMKCLEHDPLKRPSAKDIIYFLKK